MRFWDSSAIIPLLVPEAQSPMCRQLLEADPEIVVWAFTPTEVYSACYRKIREGAFTEETFEEVKQRLHILERSWSSVVQIEATQRTAERLLAVHPLHAADALQLAAALVAFDHQPAGAEFVSFDDRLNRAARREGFRLI